MIALSVEFPRQAPKSPHTFSADALMVIRCSSVKMERRYFVRKTK